MWLKKNMLFSVVVMVSIFLLGVALYINSAFLLNPELRIQNAMYKLISQGEGIKGTAVVQAKMVDSSKTDGQPDLVQLIINGTTIEGEWLYKKDQDIVHVQGGIVAVGEEVVPLEFHLEDLKNYQEDSLTILKKELQELSGESEKSREKLVIEQGHRKLPVYVDCYTYSNSQTDGSYVSELKILMDKNGVLRGATIMVRYDGMELSVTLSVEKIYKKGEMEAIDLHNSVNLKEYGQMFLEVMQPQE